MISHFETADNARLNVIDEGEGLPVIFQHGLCGDAAQTREAFPTKQGFRCVTIEARGHGGSQPGPLDRLSIATFAADVASYIEHKLAAPIIVGGISMGAAISLRLAVKRPELVKGLIIIRPAWLTDPGPDNMGPNAEVGRLLKELPADQAHVAFLASSTGRELAKTAPDNLASLTGFFSRSPLEVTAALLSAISADGPGVTEVDIRAIRVPTLVIGHAKDFIHPLKYAVSLADSIRDAHFVEITPKVESRAQYVADLHKAIGNFLKEMKDNG